MATPIELFNFYRRYKWRAQDFQSIQDALIAEADVLAQGAYNAAVLEGLAVTAATGLQVAVEAGIASGPTGNLMAQAAQVLLNVTAPTGGNPAKSLIVIRPLTVQKNYITKPTSPFETVPLNFTRDSELVFIQGTESATPDYPAKGSEDVILAGVKIATGQSSLTDNDFDFNVRENLGVNSEHIGKRVNSEDVRLKPYRSTYKVLGIKPSQTSGSQPKLFSFPGKTTPSIFPKSAGGLYNDADTFIDFVSGAITGGDEVSLDFTPTIPTGSNSIVATVFLTTSDVLSVQYGVQGTLAQCLDAIKNQDTSGAAGSLYATQTDYKVCYAVITSIGGSVSDIRIVDARALGGGGGGGTTATTVLIRATLSGATVPFNNIDGQHVQTTNQDLAAIVISMLNSGTSGSTVVRVNQYRAGAFIASATAFLNASSGNPASATCTLSSILSLLIGDLITFDVVSVANGAPEELTVEYYEVIPGSTPSVNQFAAVYPFIIGSPAQVLSGEATHSTFTSAQAAAVDGDSILFLKGTYSENISVSKTLLIKGLGHGSYLNGTVTFTNTANYSSISDMRIGDNMTLDTGVADVSVTNIWFITGKTATDNGTGSYIQAFTE